MCLPRFLVLLLLLLLLQLNHAAAKSSSRTAAQTIRSNSNYNTENKNDYNARSVTNHTLLRHYHQHASPPSQSATDATVPAMEQQQQGNRNILTFGTAAQEEQCLNALKRSCPCRQYNKNCMDHVLKQQCGINMNKLRNKQAKAEEKAQAKSNSNNNNNAGFGTILGSARTASQQYKNYLQKECPGLVALETLKQKCSCKNSRKKRSSSSRKKRGGGGRTLKTNQKKNKSNNKKKGTRKTAKEAKRCMQKELQSILAPFVNNKKKRRSSSILRTYVTKKYNQYVKKSCVAPSSATTAAPSEAPSAAGTAASSATVNPIPPDAKTQVATPFSLTYALPDPSIVPTDADFAEVTTLMHAYLQDVLSGGFTVNFLINYQSVAGPVVNNAADGVVSQTYTLTAVFSPTSLRVPDTATVDRNIAVGFSLPASLALNSRFGALPETNPFRQTTSVTYNAQPVPKP